jgi:hypothetical protein
MSRKIKPTWVAGLLRSLDKDKEFKTRKAAKEWALQETECDGMIRGVWRLPDGQHVAWAGPWLTISYMQPRSLSVRTKSSKEQT